MQNITVSSEGSYLITTESGSEYIVDLTEKTLLRNVQSTPEELIAAGVDDSLRGAYKANSNQSRMRNDNKPSPLVNIILCETGKPAAFLISGIAEYPDITTLRATTPVVKIEKLG